VPGQLGGQDRAPTVAGDDRAAAGVDAAGVVHQEVLEAGAGELSGDDLGPVEVVR
jgi:hypothetical protein